MLEERSYIDSTINALFDRLLSSIESLDGVRQDFSAYKADPVGWCKDVLGEKFPPEVEKLMQSVIDYEVTVAQSCNAYGKSFAASRIALWWLFSLPNSQVFITAAPYALTRYYGSYCF